jgi:hypothetical protein
MAALTFTPLAKPIKRDRWDRPLIEPVDGGKPVPYTRVSTLAKALDNKEALMRWKQRQTAIGLGKRPDLVSMAAAVAGDNRKLDEIVKEAMSAAESNRAANVGTTLHALTEVVDEGRWPEHVTENLESDLRAYMTAMHGIEIVAAEQFIVCDEVQAAGTFDRLVRLPDGQLVIADIKTGQHEPSYPHATTIQTSVYARGHLYDPEKGRVGYLPAVDFQRQAANPLCAMSQFKGMEFYRRIADLCLSGAMSHAEIAEAYGVNKTTVARWARVCRDVDLLPSTYRGKPSWHRSCAMCGAPRSAHNPNQVRPPYTPAS